MRNYMGMRTVLETSLFNLNLFALLCKISGGSAKNNICETLTAVIMRMVGRGTKAVAIHVEMHR
jgi:hypothetical protein